MVFFVAVFGPSGWQVLDTRDWAVVFSGTRDETVAEAQRLNAEQYASCCG